MSQAWKGIETKFNYAAAEKKERQKQYEKEAKTKASLNKNGIEHKIKLNKNTSVLSFIVKLQVLCVRFLFSKLKIDVENEINVKKWAHENERVRKNGT